MSMITFQDFNKIPESQRGNYALRIITEHCAGEPYTMAMQANAYDKQRNVTINEFVKTIYSLSGKPVVDFTASNAKIASNFFNRLNTQRCNYSLGNGITFPTEGTKEKLGKDVDHIIHEAAYFALIHGVTFLFWNYDKIVNFDLTEFAPLWDEQTGALRAGVRFWQLATDRPLYFTIYEQDGYTDYVRPSSGADAELLNPKRGYKLIKQQTAIGDIVDVSYENYPNFPIVPMYGSRIHQSTLVGMKASIDNFDLIRSGFANDLNDCAEIYWLISNCGGMDDKDLARVRDRLRLTHIATTSDDSATITPYTQDIPYQARTAFCNDIRHGLYEDFGALDVGSISASAKTATEIRASYQPLDDNADDFEYQVSQAIVQLLALIGIEGEAPIYKRNMIANETEITNMVLAEGEYLDEETVLRKLPNIASEEIPTIMERKAQESINRYGYSEEEDGQNSAPDGTQNS